MKIKNLIIIGLSVIIVGMGVWIGYKYYQMNYLFEEMNNSSYSVLYTSYVIHRNSGSKSWPVTHEGFNGYVKLYVAEETSEDGKSQTLKIKIKNNTERNIEGFITARFIKSETEETKQNFVGDFFSLTSEEHSEGGSYAEFEYTVDVSDLTDAEKNATQYMINVCENKNLCIYSGN